MKKVLFAVLVLSMLALVACMTNAQKSTASAPAEMPAATQVQFEAPIINEVQPVDQFQKYSVTPTQAVVYSANLSELSELGVFGDCTTSYENGVSKAELNEGETITLTYVGHTSYEFIGTNTPSVIYKSRDFAKTFFGWVTVQIVPANQSITEDFVKITCKDPRSSKEVSVRSNYVVNDIYILGLVQGRGYIKLLSDAVQIIEVNEFEKWQAAGMP